MTAEPATPDTPSISDKQLTKLNILLNEAGLSDRQAALEWISGVLGIEITSRKDLTMTEASELIDRLADGKARSTEQHPLADDQPPVQEVIRRVIYDIGQVGVGKGGYNQTQNYRFRGIDQFVDALSPIFARHGLVILPTTQTPTITEHPTSRGGTQFMVVMAVRWEIIGPRGDKVYATTLGQAMDASDKAANKAMSAAFKYLLAQVFAIPHEGWTDGDGDNPTVDSLPAAQRNSQPRPEQRERPPAPASGPDHDEIMRRLGDYATNQSMTLEQFTERFRNRHNGISVNEMATMPREMLLGFLRQVEEYQQQTVSPK